MAGYFKRLLFGKGVDDSPPTISELLHLSNANIERINFLTSNELSHHEEPLNPKQCRSLSSKLVRTLEDISGPFFPRDQGSTSTASTLSTRAFENFYLVSERAKELVESCCSEDWCQASVFQIQNEEAFKDILLETSLCYSAIYELIKDKVPYQDLRLTPTFEPPSSAEVMEDLRLTPTFEPPSSAEVMQDRLALLQRYQDFVYMDCSSDSLVQKQHLAKHLLRRLKCVISQSEDFDVTVASLWSHGDEWGENSKFLGGNVCKTTWLGVPCAKVFEYGLEEELILTKARTLALVNHPNIVKFISCGHDKDNTGLFIAMEHIDASLYSVIKKRNQLRKGAPFPILSAVHIMLQIAYGTCYLHDAEVVHGHLETSNIVVRQFSAPRLQDYFHVKLINFCLSKLNLSASRSNTISRPSVGTTVYMPPEAFHHGRANWPKADVYSFGIMCSVILSGKEPFPHTKYSEVKEAICSGVRPVLPMETPEDLACLIKECWDAKQNVRPSLIDICTRLAQIRHGLLKEDADGHGFKDDLDDFAILYIQDRITKLSNANKQDCKQILGNVIEEDESFILDPELGIQMPLEGPNITASHRSKSSLCVEVPRQPENGASQNFVDHKRRSSTPGPQTHIKDNVERIIELTSHQSQETLNPSQCRSVSSKLRNTLESIERMLCSLNGDKSFLNAALESFYLVSERAKELVESCGSVDWCQASTFQIQNEEAFKEILLEMCLCYNVIFELFEGKVGARHHELDLRTSRTFEPPSSAEVLQDQLALIERFRAVVEDGVVPVSQHQHLARYLLRRLLSQSNGEGFDACMWPDDQLGKQKIEGTLLGNNVIKARWLDVLCAIKEFENYEYEEGQEALIVKEARILARLNHPNIVKFICCSHNNETSRDYIAMELMEQGLYSLIAKVLRKAKNKKGDSSPFPLLSAMDIMLQVAYGACYLHDNGVAHRDIKSSNVVVRQITTPHLQDYLQVKLVDFGLSKSKLRASKSNTISHPKTGTPVYMPPEAFNEGRANWFKADVYSFGILCSVILSGKEPFPVKEIERSRLHEALCSGTRPMIPSETPPELTSLIQECWSTDPDRRPDFVDICTRLATLRHKLLRGGDSFAFQPPVHIQEMIKKRSDARQNGSLHRMRPGLLQNQMFDCDAEPH